MFAGAARRNCTPGRAALLILDMAGEIGDNRNSMSRVSDNLMIAIAFATVPCLADMVHTAVVKALFLRT